MFLTEKLISLVAPHYCIVCGDEGAVVCEWCMPDFATPLPSRCYACKSQTDDSLVCKKCRKTSRIKRAWVRTSYEGNPKQLIHDFKFERKTAAALPAARLLAETLPYLTPDTLITHIPTAPDRVRQRGYDHAKLLAEALARELGLKHTILLIRLTRTRQVGAKRKKRLSQMQNAFRSVNSTELQKATVLLVDDLVTTGATIESAAKCLKTAGAKTVNAAVFAQKQ